MKQSVYGTLNPELSLHGLLTRTLTSLFETLDINISVYHCNMNMTENKRKHSRSNLNHVKIKR